MAKPPIHKITIAGGGTAGWMVASVLSKILGSSLYDIRLIESDEIGTVGVGEATIPMIKLFIQFLGIDEYEFVRETNGTFKLGIEFIDWKNKGESYFHPFGSIGKTMNGIEFIHYWLRLSALGGNKDFGRFNAETLAARENKFAKVDVSDRPELAPINYAYQFDASLFASYLRKFSETRGVKRCEGKIVKVNQNSQTGYIDSLTLADGKTIDGHLFIDCTGFASLLLGKTLNVGFQDWNEWLPCNSALAAPTLHTETTIPPYTKATAREAGWQWKIPLQHRVGNGYVYCNKFISDDKALEMLLKNLDGQLLKDPKLLKFTTGHRHKIWEKNVIAVGLSGGFLEPLESTAIHLIQTTISKLLAHLPKEEINESVQNQFNREIIAEYTNIRDFLIAHYYVTEREDTPFWQYCKHMSIPDSLKERLDMFINTGNSNTLSHELFKETSWFAVLVGQGLTPKAYHPIADVISEDELRISLSRLRTSITGRVQILPSQNQFIQHHCMASLDDKQHPSRMQITR